MRLEQYGWESFFAEAFQAHAGGELRAGRICRAQGNTCRLLTEGGPVEATLSGRFRRPAPTAQRPVVGDWAVFQGSPAVIEAILPRKTKFSRKQAGERVDEQILAANIDLVFLVSGLDRDFNLRRLERYLVLAGESGAAPVVVLNKADLCADPGRALREARSVAMGAPVLLVSALSGIGLEDLASQAPAGRTAALLGSSGAGKSTLVNRLLGYERQRVQEVDEHDGRGRHTTSHRELIPMPGGWLLMDLPGLRELQLWAEAAGVDRAFQDVAALVARCRFRNCRHQGEPGCAVAEALEAQELDSGRVQSYLKLQREVEHLERKQDQQAALEEKRRIKRLHRMIRSVPHRGGD